MRDVMGSVEPNGRKVDVKQLRREKISRANTQRIMSVSAPHLIKPPWKKQKDKTYRIRMTCGSILWLKISPQSRWITCRKIIFREISKSTEQLVRLGWRRKASSLSVIQARLWGNFSPSHQVQRAAHTSTRRALCFRRLDSTGQSVCWCSFWRGESVCARVFSLLFFFCDSVVSFAFFFLVCFPPPRSQKFF